MNKPITQPKQEVLERLYNKAYNQFSKNKEKIAGIIGDKNEHDNPETAALVVIAMAILNLDEMITKN